MDGVRAHWNGKEILSKQSKKIPCPFWFMEGLSKDRAFDGELWMGRGSYEKVMSTLIAKSNAESWKDMKYVIFDLPQSPDPYEIRIKELKTIEFPSHVTAVESALCFENSQMLKRLEELVKNGGEGLMMNNPHSTYIKGRSNAILKVKMYDECEVQLLEITSSGLFCQQTNGVESMVGCYQQVIHNPPPIGSVLTVKHNGFYQKGLLKNPVFWRHRPDIEWTEISISKKSLVPLLVLFLFSQTENANWTNREKSKEFFEALKIQLNYKTLDDFYGISVEEIGNHGGKALLENMFEGSLVKVLHYAYPDHKWLPWKFRQKAAKGYWDQVENQFAFVDWLGRELNFKCLNDWYKVTRKAFKENGGVTLLEYNSTPSKILKQVYPEHLWLVWKFDEVPRRFWDKKENQKEFLDWLEIHLSFQTKEDWYNLKQTDIITEGGKSLLDRHGSISQLVRSIYPDHTWQQDKFLKEKTGYWIADQ